MNDIKKYWFEQRNYLVEMAEGTKESQSVSFNLLDIYDKLSASEELIVNDTLADWTAFQGRSLFCYLTTDFLPAIALTCLAKPD